MSVDPKLIRDSFALVSAYGGDVVEYFYAHLFAQHPDLRQMFPVGMAEQRDRLLKALALVVTNIDNLDELTPTLRQLGHDHRKFDVKPEHYDAVGASLLATLELFAGEAWTPRMAASWAAAYGLAAQTMLQAAEASSDGAPAWWEADVVSHERRCWDIGVFNVKPRQRYNFVPGQYVTIETMEWPKQWRRYSIANSPRPDGTLEFHVKQVDSGPVSWALVDAIRVGSVIKLGPPAGRLVLDEISPRAIVMIAGGTGLAPLKAIIQHLVDRGETRPVQLFMGARTELELYDLPAIRALASQHWWLTVTPVVSVDPSYQGYRGYVGDVAAGYAPWLDRDIYICGPVPMVASARQRLLRTGVQPARIHHEIGLDLGSFELAAVPPGREIGAEVEPAPAALVSVAPAPTVPQPLEAPILDQWFAMQSPPTAAAHVNGEADPPSADRLQQLRAQIEYRRSLRRPLRR
ncbi:MAG TPA: globin domain-containing protein [Actinomycetes bacterium]|nr:globin domain-containing protein [Actinomycetes bacterium]